MKITIIQGAFLPIPPVLGGGAEKMWYALALEFARRGHEVVYISRTYPGMPDEEWFEGVYHRRIAGYHWPTSLIKLKWLDLLYTRRVRSVVPPDSEIVVSNTFWTPLLLPAALRKRCFIDVARMPKGQMRLYYEAARLRANSTPVATAIRRELPRTQHNRVITIPNPLPFKSLPGIDFAAKKPLFLYTGRIHPEKGLDLLIRAYKSLKTSWKLRIVGPWEDKDGGGGKAYLSHLEKLAGENGIEFTGPVHDIEQLNQHYKEASVFVYPSVAERGETFGLAPLEAMAWGCTPIVSGITCFQDFITHEQNGLIFNQQGPKAVGMLERAMRMLMNDPAYRVKLATKALQVRESHATATIASYFLDAFEQVANQQLSTKPLMI